jgi:hypothetical protein
MINYCELQKSIKKRHRDFSPRQIFEAMRTHYLLARTLLDIAEEQVNIGHCAINEEIQMIQMESRLKVGL